MELTNETVAVVTGAGSGIGLAMSHSFAAKGCSIVLADVQDDALEVAASAIGEHGVQTLSVHTDVSKADEVEALAAATMERFGAVHVVCNNAGVGGAGDPWFGPIESWEWVMGVNFWGVVHGCRTFLPHIVASGGGHIVNTASIAGLFPGFSSPYDASKHAVVAISEGLFNSAQAAMMPVGVSCLCPGWVRTGILDSDRNWPDELGELPENDDVAAEVMRSFVRRAIDEGMQPAAVADLVVRRVEEDQFWIFPHLDFLELVMERFHSIGEQQNPGGTRGQTPGMPSEEEMMAEVLRAMGEAGQTG